MFEESLIFGSPGTITVISNTKVDIDVYVTKAILNAGLIEFTVSTVVTAFPLKYIFDQKL